MCRCYELGKCHHSHATNGFCNICGLRKAVCFAYTQQEYCNVRLVKLAVWCAVTLYTAFLLGGAFQWNGCKERCLCLTGLAHSEIAPPHYCLHASRMLNTQSGPAKTNPADPKAGDLEGRRQASVDKCRTVWLTCGRKPWRSCSAHPSCLPGYWVTLVTGKELSWALGGGGGDGKPKGASCVSMPVVSGQTWKTCDKEGDNRGRRVF